MLPNFTDTGVKKNLVLISSLHESFFMVYDRYLKNKKIDEYEKILNELENKCLKKFFGRIKILNKNVKIPKRMFYYQSIEFFKMCIFVRKFIKDQDIKLAIIERNREGTEMHKFEKISFKNYLAKITLRV